MSLLVALLLPTAAQPGGSIVPAARWGVNVHWVRCEPHQPCPGELGAAGGPQPGEAAQLAAAFGRARTGIRWFLAEQQLGVYNFVAKPMFEALDGLVSMAQPLGNLEIMYAHWSAQLPPEEKPPALFEAPSLPP